MKTPPALEKKVSEDDVARQVAVLHGISAFFSYAAGEGPQKTAPLCLLLSQRIDSMLKEVGIG